MRTWKGLLEKKSASLTRFWLLAKREMFGTSSTARLGFDDDELHLDVDRWRGRLG